MFMACTDESQRWLPCGRPPRIVAPKLELCGGSEKMQRSRMLTELRNLMRATRLARANRMTLNEVLQQAAERQHRLAEPRRRRFVKDLGSIAGAGLLLNNLPARAFGNRAPRIAIVGGGIAG